MAKDGDMGRGGAVLRGGRRRLMRAGVVAAVLGVVGVLGVVWMARSEPGWYREALAAGATAEVDAAANRFEDELIELGNFLSGEVAAEVRALRGVGRGGSEPVGPGIGPGGGGTHVVRIRGDELAAFVRRWSVLHSDGDGAWAAWVGRSGTVVSVREGRLVVGARATGLGGWVGGVVSAEIRVSVLGGERPEEPGKLVVEVGHLRVGRLPVPGGWEVVRERSAEAVRSAVRRWQADARVDGRGRGNMPLALASGGGVLLAVLEGRPSDNVIFVPVDERYSGGLRVVGIRPADGGRTLEVTVRMLEAAERAGAAARVRGR